MSGCAVEVGCDVDQVNATGNAARGFPTRRNDTCRFRLRRVLEDCSVQLTAWSPCWRGGSHDQTHCDALIAVDDTCSLCAGRTRTENQVAGMCCRQRLVWWKGNDGPRRTSQSSGLKRLLLAKLQLPNTTPGPHHVSVPSVLLPLPHRGMPGHVQTTLPPCDLLCMYWTFEVTRDKDGQSQNFGFDPHRF